MPETLREVFKKSSGLRKFSIREVPKQSENLEKFSKEFRSKQSENLEKFSKSPLDLENFSTRVAGDTEVSSYISDDNSVRVSKQLLAKIFTESPKIFDQTAAFEKF